MQFEVIETIKKSYIIEVTESWPCEFQKDPEAAKKHLEYGIDNLGIEGIKAKSITTESTITIDQQA